MKLKKIEILGYRWFKSNQVMNFAIPDWAKKWSWLTIIVWPNNSWKSTILEAIKIRENESPSFSVWKRNQFVDEIIIKYDIDERTEILKSINKSSSETIKEWYIASDKIFVLPSRRSFAHNFGKNTIDKNSYIQNYNSNNSRDQWLTWFYLRLFEINKSIDNKNKFNVLLEKALWYLPNWTIDQEDNGQYFIKFILDWNSYHSSEWVWEWIISIFSIIDSLYDSKEWDIIVIDEPELSLHPQLQKRLSEIFYQYSDIRQIIISTHSPYFINFESLFNEWKLVRIINNWNWIEIYELSLETAKSLKWLLNDINNPHVLWLDAKEIFFQEDNIILVEWQEDVVLFPKVLEQINKSIKWHIFWWWMWWADKVEVICSIFKDLGYKKVFVIFDNDKKDCIETKSLKTTFPEYTFDSIPADDIRFKKKTDQKEEKEWLLKDWKFLEKFKEDTEKLISKINIYF